MELCRCCLDQATLKLNSWRKVRELKIQLSSTFHEITGITADTGDGICTKCFNELIAAYKFRLKAIEGHFKLKEILENPIKVHVQETDDDFHEDVEVQHQRARLQCAHCPQSYEYKRGLRSHLQKKHFKHLMEHLCDNCGAKFVFKSELSEHVRFKHKLEKTFTCHICSRTFLYNTSLTVHLTSHSTVRKFACSYCGMGFKTRGALFNHEKRHKSEDNCFECPLCDQKFTQKLYYEKHLSVTHSNERNYKCNECGKSFKTKKSYEQHQRAHTGDLFKCDQCVKAYTSKDKLKFHIQCSHGAEKRFKCNSCESLFFSNSKLNRHLRNVHKSQTTVDNRKLKKIQIFMK